jgi:hypothetical protein
LSHDFLESKFCTKKFCGGGHVPPEQIRFTVAARLAPQKKERGSWEGLALGNSFGLKPIAARKRQVSWRLLSHPSA